jgi:hypothetical protein
MTMARSEGSQFIALQHSATNLDPQATGLRTQTLVSMQHCVQQFGIGERRGGGVCRSARSWCKESGPMVFTEPKVSAADPLATRGSDLEADLQAGPHCIANLGTAGHWLRLLPTAGRPDQRPR